MAYDVVVVGAGPAGLAAAIRLRQLSIAGGADISVCVLEKGAEVGAHILSGAVFEPRPLDELIPDWKAKDAPLGVPVTRDRFKILTKTAAFAVPTALMPAQCRNHGNYIISLGNLCRWLAKQAEDLGVDVFPGFPAAEVLYDEAGRVRGVATGELGIAKDGARKDSYQPGMELHAKYTLIGEGCRGSLTKTLMARFALDQGADPQSYGIGLKELWQLDPKQHREGLVLHTAGWPMDRKTWGGSFIYHLENNQAAVGYVVGLDYRNPHLSPFDEFQRFKTHPAIRPMFEGGKRIAYGARALNEGGWQSIPKLVFPGGMLLGCAAGFLDVPKIKGSHNAMKSGALAAEAVFETLCAGDPGHGLVESYPERLRASWVYGDLRKARNFRPAFARWGLLGGMIYGALDLKLLGGRAPWTLHNRHPDHSRLKPAAEMPKIAYRKPDGIVSFDKLSSVFLSNTNHEEDQPVHLRLKDSTIAVAHNLPLYDAPEQRYCPAGVYEILEDPEGAGPRLQINAQNCVHCKACDIKDPRQNIDWVTPEGSGGPNYPNM